MRISYNKILRNNYKENERKTFAQVEEARKKEMNEISTKLFGNVPKGIHLKELPKFSESNSKDYWKLKKNYSQKALTTSQRELNRMTKYWANPDELYLNDYKDMPSVQKDYTKISVKDNVADKVNNQVYLSSNEDQTRFKHNAGYGSWATQEASRKILKSVYEVDAQERQSFKNYLDYPLYSSFSPNKAFPDSKKSTPQ